MLSAAGDWLSLHDQTEAKIVELNNLQGSRDQNPRIKRDIRNAISIISANIKTLDESLGKVAIDPSSMGDQEFQRRQGMLAMLKERCAFTQSKQKQTSNPSVAVPIETPRTLLLNNSQMIQNQQADMNLHEEKLDDILHGVGRLKNMGENINSELLLHSELLSDLDRGIDDTHKNIVQGTNRASNLMRKDSSCMGMFVIFVLLLIIVVLLIM